ncbi:hypothetical protein C8Q70DRAFT_933159 [Cubamyces menziesii]|uniref:Uncharacterized protein n=1 Tax=Trametes cubensis TaxID=1111947 RepID=A0AAD7U4A6_9APHY|nr:hypothetical protein C8Q70DRAFT_933159 [Cubamyces menziesii]KAJ8501784.1 hypothetical protein ONZ51_g364 [Trametes cubensis]
MPANGEFNLDISGVAGFFGGDVAVTAMATVHVYRGRRWLGWYNQPGSYEVARRYGQLCSGRFWDTLYPGPNNTPALVFKFDTPQPGPKYMSAQSGASPTGHAARLLFEGCRSLPLRYTPAANHRRTSPGFLTIIDLPYAPTTPIIPRRTQGTAANLLAALSIAVSLTASALCAYLEDWYSCAVILLGVITNGVSCYVIGRGTLQFTFPEPDKDSPSGSGILIGKDELVLLRGSKPALHAITRGQFVLDYSSKPQYLDIALSSTLLSIQFLAQLLLIPQGKLSGQLIFLGTFAVSAAYNSFLSSLDIESIQRAFLLEDVLHVGPADDALPRATMEKYELGTWTTMSVLALMLLAPSAEKGMLGRILDELLPNHTDLWGYWKAQVLQNIQDKIRSGSADSDEEFRFEFSSAEGYRPLLQLLYKDSHAAAEMYAQYRGKWHSAK